MIIGYFHEGSGLGNQLFRYVTTRVLAEDKGVDWGMVGEFKGTFFTEKPRTSQLSGDLQVWQEKIIRENGVDIRGYDPEINFVPDNIVIDGEFQDERYWGHRLKDIAHWLRTPPVKFPDDTCLIGFRGGEYTLFPDLFLSSDYWDVALDLMKARGIKKFEVHTDDVVTATQFFPNFKIVRDMETNWRAGRNAKHAIIANTSFYILNRLLRHNEGDAVTIAPHYWARRNIGVWALPQNYYKQFLYV